MEYVYTVWTSPREQLQPECAVFSGFDGPPQELLDFIRSSEGPLEWALDHNGFWEGNGYRVERFAPGRRERVALQRLLACPDLNLDDLEPETRAAIAQAETVLKDLS